MARLHALRCVLLAALAAAISAQSLDGSSAVSLSPPPPEETSSPSTTTWGNNNASDSEDRDDPNTETPPVPDSGGAGVGSNPPAPQETDNRPVDNPGIPPDPGIGAAVISVQPVDGSSNAASTPPPPETSSPSSTAWNNNNNNNASDSEDRNTHNTETPPMPDNAGSGFGYNARAPDDTDDRLVGRAGVSRDSGISTGAMVGIAAGAVATVVLIVVFVRTSSARRASAAAAHDQQYLTHSQDLAMSTLSLKSVKVVESSDADSPAPPSGRMPSTLLRKTFDATVHNKSSNSFSRVSGQQQATSHADDASLEFSIEEVFAPTSSQAAFTGMKSARSPKLAFRQSRLSRPDEDDVYVAPSPVRPSQLRYSQSSRSSNQSTDSSMDVPMLGGGDGQRRDDHGDHDDHDDDHHDESAYEATVAHGADDCESTRDIPVLARGSEESVDSVEEDEDVEISI